MSSPGHNALATTADCPISSSPVCACAASNIGITTFYDITVGSDDAVHIAVRRQQPVL